MSPRAAIIITLTAGALLAALNLHAPEETPDAPSAHRRPERPARQPRFRPPASVPAPTFHTVPPPAVEVSRLLEAGDYPSLDAAIADWFAADPQAARDWLAARPDPDHYGAAIAMIATSIARSGDPGTALEWTTFIPAGAARDQAVFDIYAHAARTGSVTPADIEAAPLPAEQRQRLLTGVADD